MNENRSKIEQLKALGWQTSDFAELLQEMCQEYIGKVGQGEGKDTKNNRSLERHVTEILQEMGIPSSIRGFAYIREAVMYMYEKGTKISLTKELYPAIAEKFDVSPTNAERCIRHAIDISIDTQQMKLLGYPTMENYKITNGKFITAVVERIRYNLL